MITSLHAYWNSISITPFLSGTTPITNEVNQTLAALMCDGIVSHFPSSMCANTDVKSIKSGESAEKTRVLKCLPSASFD